MGSILDTFVEGEHHARIGDEGGQSGRGVSPFACVGVSECVCINSSMEG